MVRKLSLAVALALGISPLGVHALGLGDIRLHSRLNQSLHAEIQLHSVDRGGLGGLNVRLAGPEAFDRVGLPRSFELTKLRFEPARLPDGTAVIKVTSREPIREPFLNFLLEVNWPKGRMLRQYSLLLDPPITYPEKVAERTARQQQQTIPLSAPPPVPAAAATSKSGAISRGLARGKVEDGQYGPIQPQDTLWSIAARLRYPAAEMPQMVMALQQSNPQAFIDGNINHLRRGEVLRVPSEAEVLALDPGQARSTFNQQMGRSGTAAVAAKPRKPKKAPPAETAVTDPVAAAGEATEGAGKPSAPVEGELKIAAAAPSDAKPGEPAAKPGESPQAMAAAQEAAESAKRENEELKSRLAMLEDQIKDMRRLINLKDDQLAQLQAAVGAESKPPAEARPPVEAKPPVEEKPPVEAKPPVEEKPPVEAKPPVEEKPPVEAKPPVEEKPPVEAKPPVEEQPPVEAKPPKKPVEVVEVGAEDAGIMGLVDDTLGALMDNAVYIGGGVAAFGVLLGALVFLRRRRSREEEGQESILTSTDGERMDREGPMSGLTTEETSFLDNLSTTGGFTTTLSSSDESEADETSFLSDFVPSDVEALQEDTGEVDPLAEADVYIAYGRYKQAEELIRQALDKSPGNHALRYKLFEIFHAAKDGAAFDGAIREAQTAGMEVGDPSGWQKVLAMQGDLRKGGGAKPAPVAAMEEELDLGDLEGALGDLEISGAAEPQTAATIAAAPQDEGLGGLGDLGDLGDLDFGLDLTGLGAEEAAAPAGKPAAGAGAEEELDLSDLLGDLEVTGLGTGKTQAAAAKPAQPSAEEAFDLDLGLDLDLGGELPGAKTGAAGELLGGLGRTGAKEEDEFDLDLSLGGGSGIPDLGRQIGGERGEAEGLQVTGLTKPAKAPESGLGEVLDFDLSASLLADSPAAPVAEAAVGDEAEVETKIDLARAYIDMGDAEGARDILNEVVAEGNAAQKAEAQKLIASL
jgi:pilus assembly protein FimV